MKITPFLLAAAVLCAAFSSVQAASDPIAQFNGKTGTFNDTLRGVSATCPAGWTIRQAGRWSGDDTQTTIFFSAPNVEGTTQTSLYYKKYATPPAQPAGVEAFLRDEAQKKAELRIKGGLADYKIRANSYSFRTVNGRPALSFMADYTGRDGKKCTEYNTRVVCPTGAALFFMLGSDWEVEALKPEFESMIASLHLDIK